MCAFVFTGTAGAGDVTPQKVVDLTYAAVQSMVDKGEDQTFQIINDPKGEFVDGELYAFVYDMAGTILAHPNSKLIGKALIKIKDVKGKAFVAEFISIAKSDKGEGWSDYWWPKLGEKNASQKVTFIKRVARHGTFGRSRRVRYK